MFIEHQNPKTPLQQDSPSEHDQSLQQSFILDPKPPKKQLDSPNPNHYSYLNQLLQESTLSPDKQNAKTLAQNKLRHKKVKQKLNLLTDQILDQNLLKEHKDFTSPNKSRLLKLSIELQKSIRTQAIDYQLVESLLKEIQKIVQHKREHDILILRGAKTMSTLIALVKRFPALHKTEAAQSMLSMELGLRMLRIMLSLGGSRELLLISNQMSAISTLLSCALMRQQKKIAVNCLYLLNFIISTPIRTELDEIMNVNIEYMLCSSLLKRLKTYLQNCIIQDDPVHSQFILLGFKLYHAIMTRSCQKELGRPIYGTPVMDNLSRAVSCYFEQSMQLMTQSLIELLFEKDAELQDKYYTRDDEIPNFKINILVYLFKCLNIIFHVNIAFAQKIIDCSSIFLKSLHYLFNYVKQTIKQTHQNKILCNQIVIFIGNLTCQNQMYQNMVRESGILMEFCNHPLEYMMEPLKHIFVPAFCCLIYKNHQNFNEAFKQNSVLTLLKYIEKELNKNTQKKIEDDPCIQLCVPKGSQNNRSLSRKTSVSSMNSTYSKTSMAESYSTQTSVPVAFSTREVRLDYKFRPEYWEELVSDLKKLDD